MCLEYPLVTQVHSLKDTIVCCHIPTVCTTDFDSTLVQIARDLNLGKSSNIIIFGYPSRHFQSFGHCQ